MWIKICGIQDEEDLRAALEARADAVGFIVARDSASAISPGQARCLIEAARGRAETVLVTDRRDALEIISLWKAAPADTVQISGGVHPETLQALRGSPFRIIPALWAEAAGELPKEILLWADRIILDARGRRSPDWNISRQIFSDYDGLRIIAGGLNPENVARAVEASGADGVDAHSGLRSGGRACPRLCREFVRGARKAPRG